VCVDGLAMVVRKLLKGLFCLAGEAWKVAAQGLEILARTGDSLLAFGSRKRSDLVQHIVDDDAGSAFCFPLQRIGLARQQRPEPARRLYPLLLNDVVEAGGPGDQTARAP